MIFFLYLDNNLSKYILVLISIPVAFCVCLITLDIVVPSYNPNSIYVLGLIIFAIDAY